MTEYIDRNGKPEGNSSKLLVLTGSGSYIDPDVLAQMQKEKVRIIYTNLDQTLQTLREEHDRDVASIQDRQSRRVDGIIEAANRGSST